MSTVAEETKNPARDLPIGSIASLVICTIFYVVVAAVFTGAMPYGDLVKRLATEQAEPLTMALNHVAPQARWASAVVAFGSVVAHTAVLLVFQLGQPRIFFSMARDAMLMRGDRPFLVVQGEEVTDPLRGAPLHINGLDLTRLVPPQGGATVVDVLQRNVDAIRAELRARAAIPLRPSL